MTDYGQELEFGLFLSPDASGPERILQNAQLADVLGLQLVTFQDHPYQAKHLDAWTLLSFVGARTNAVRVAPNVVSLPLRPPAVLAKSAATLDLLTGGRVDLALGTGAFWDAIAAAGGPRRTPKEAVDALIEAIEIIRASWAGQSIRVEGEHYRVVGMHGGPQPAHDIPIWLGAYGKRMLRVTGRLADGWVPSMGYADPPALGAMNLTIDEAAVAAGRDPAQIRRIYNVFGQFGRRSGFLRGTPDDWADDLSQLTIEHGMSTYVLGTDDPDVIRRYAEEVAPAVREKVDKARSAPRPEPTDGESEREKISVTDRSGPRPMSVTPTPDDGTRLGEMPWDESDRPTVAPPENAEFTDAQQATPAHLIEIHDGLRAELAQVREIVAQVRRGHLSVGQARSVINTMTMRQNNWTLGAYCESYCRIVTGHHTLEDRSIFPHLRRSDPALGEVIDRLEEEHEIIADVLYELDRALVALVEGEGYGRAGVAALDELEDKVNLLSDTLLSHLAYEERELLYPLAKYGFY
ncbi:LLM class flavin-dependent oxidoreductase [Epidermidibacterium keratini]|uniref:LLM class flavin-dependent oxidoreductase n=1 Tax=Epidermidibacterium keratini TaxID=1891644 RepID=A0A7L4YID3_9ACTN|nr:LLM class flavin-dependent oxidoreductase [Epidermidibacterium keratini]QHB98967.1 LLM class flavin-dependent oxidoreductase [Epidermidibacterium keratini]